MKKFLFSALMALGVILSPLNAEARPSFSGGSHSFSSSSGCHSFGGGSSSFKSSSSYTRSSAPAYSPWSSSHSSGSSPSFFHSSATPTPVSSSAPTRMFGVGSAKHFGFSGGATVADAGVTHSYGAKSLWNNGAADAQSHESSKQAYNTFAIASVPRTSYTAKTGETRPIREDDPEVRTVRSSITPDSYSTRSYRSQTFFRNVPQRTYVHVYHDSYNDTFTTWLMLQSLQTQSNWIYNHQANLDQQRLNDMYAQNSALRAQVGYLGSAHTAVNPGYVPSGVDPDLMYNDQYVEAVANPVPVYHHSISIISIFFWMLFIFFIFAFIMAVVAFFQSQRESDRDLSPHY